MRSIGITLLAITIVAPWGCSSAPLPTYPWKDRDTALRLMAENAGRLHSVQSSARLVLTDADANRVTLDAAIVAAPPDRFRLRAWKLGHAVLDLTLTPDGVWVKSDQHGPARTGRATAGLLSLNAAAIAESWPLFTGGPFARAGPDVGSRVEATDDGGPTFILRWPANTADPAHPAGDAVFTCEVDRRTLTARRYGVLDASGVERAVLKLAGYRDFGGISFPTCIEAAGADGAVLVLLDDTELNTPLAPDAFVPPADAVKQE